jgi:putative IMPACT (imprinted ancient) family translation regulator
MMEKIISPLIKELGKAVSEGVKEGIKGGADKLSEGIKEKYLQKETAPVSEISENIPSELKGIANEVEKVEQTIDFKPEAIVENADAIKVDLNSIQGKLNDFVKGFNDNLANNASAGEHVDHILNKGLDIGSDINTYVKDIKERLSQAGIDVDQILEKINSVENYSDLDDAELEESDFDEAE